MILPDVNVLVYAHREDAPEHGAYAAWLRDVAEADAPFALSEPVMAGFLRVVTHRKVFRTPTPLDEALAFLDALRERDTCRIVRPGPRHWDLFAGLCRDARATGKLIADAAHAAVAVEHGCTWASADGDFARFRALRWIHPLRG